MRQYSERPYWMGQARRYRGAQWKSWTEDARDPVIHLDQRGAGLLRSLASPCSEFRVTVQPGDSIVLHPMSAHEADLWRSGLVEKIAGNFSHPDWMIRLRPDKL